MFTSFLSVHLSSSEKEGRSCFAGVIWIVQFPPLLFIAAIYVIICRDAFEHTPFGSAIKLLLSFDIISWKFPYG